MAQHSEPEPGGTRRLVLAAHFDDAVMSCWRAITDGGSDVQVTVATVFAGSPPAGSELGDWDRAVGASDPQAAWQNRLAEDARALSGTGVRAVHLSFVDGQYLTGPEPREAIAEALAGLIEAADEVWIPAGIGAHPDHVLVAEIALSLVAGRPSFLFADLPYAARPEWVTLVQAAQRGTHDLESLQAQLRCSTLLSALAVPLVVELSADEQVAKRRAVLEYESQLDPLAAVFGRWFDDPPTAGYEVHWPAGVEQPVVERRRDHDLLAELFQRVSDNEEGRDRMRQDQDTTVSDLQEAHQRELAAVREQHAAELTSAVAHNTRTFEESTSWRLTAPVRALGRLRIRLAERRHASALQAAAVSDPTPQATEEEPSAGAALKPPPDPGVKTWPADGFNELYEQSSDPWGYSSRWYEQRKYAITIASLPLRRYRRAFEPGCSVGVLSELLAPRVDAMISADFAAPALVHAKQRLARFPQIDVRLIAVPTEWPEGSFDLIVISEMATYLSDDDLNVLVERTVGSLDPEGALVLVHYRPNTGTPHNAAEVHDRFRQHPQLGQFASHEEEAFLLDVFQPTS